MGTKKFSKTTKLYILIGLILVGVLSGAFIYANILTHGLNRDSLKGKENSQELSVNDIILTETRDGIRYWEIYGETGHYESENKVAILNRTIGNFYKDNEVAMSYEAQSGSYNEEANTITLTQDVFIALKDNTTLQCDKLIWSGSDKDIVGEGNVRINRNRELISKGNKVIINSDYSHFKLVGKTRSELYDKEHKMSKEKKL